MYIKSPLNYTGGKYKLLPNIIPMLPTSQNFVDLFAGGMNVSINANAEKIYANDHIDYLIELYEYFQKTPIEELLHGITGLIEEYALTKENLSGYNELRENYNMEKTPLKLFVLTCYSFNHQIRFNNFFKFNISFGKNRSSYNNSIEKNLINFCRVLKEKDIVLSNQDFREFDFRQINGECIVYCDPPYLISTGSYNDGKRGFGDWKEQEDKDSMELLDSLNERGFKFCMSNVFSHKGEKNERLMYWSQKYEVSYIDKTYSNCSYHFKDRDTETIEVLVMNYKN